MPRDDEGRRPRSGVYGGVSAADRRAARRRRLLDAMLKLLASEGWGHTSVRRVCQEAGLSSRFFYENFDNLDALAVAVVDEIAEETFGVMVPALGAGGAPQERITGAVTGVIARFVEDPRKARVAFIEALGSEPVMKRRLAIMRALADLIADQLGRAYPEIEDESFLRFAAFGVVGLLVELMIAWASGELDTTDDELARTTAELVLATIDGAVAAARHRSRRA